MTYYDQAMLALVIAGAVAGALAFVIAIFATRDARNANEIAAEAYLRACDAEKTAATARHRAPRPAVGTRPHPRTPTPARHRVPDENYVETTTALPTCTPKNTAGPTSVPLRVRPGGPPAAVLLPPPRPPVPTLLDAALRRDITDADWIGAR